MKVVIIIPTYNERENVDRLVEILQKLFKEIPNKWDMHILFVDDTSPDGTADVIKKKMQKYKNVHLFLNKEKIGLGGAYMKGMEHAIKIMKADLLFEMDADFQHDHTLIPQFLEKIDEGADLVLGSRYVKGGSIPQYWGFMRKVLSVGGNLFIRIMMLDNKIHDWTTGFRAVRPWVFEKVKNKITELKTYSFQLSFLYHAKNAGAKVAEVPLNFKEREWGESKLPGVQSTIKTLWFVVQTRVVDFFRSRFFKFGTVGFIGYVINASGLELLYRAGLTPALSAAIAAELAIISNFTLNNLWTFSEQKIDKVGQLIKKFLQFNLTSLGAVGIQALVVGIGTYVFGDQTRQIFLFVAVVFLVIPFNYAMYNLFIWKTWKVPALARLQRLVG